MRLLTLLLVSSVMLLGCTSRHVYVPTLYGADPARFEALNKANLERKVALINAQQKNDQVLLGEKGVNEYYGSLRDLTETIIMNAEHELNKRQTMLDEASSTALNIRVTSIDTKSSLTTVEVVMQVEVVTGAGLTKTIKVTNKTPGSIPRAYNGAASAAVIEMLSDPDLLSYLSGE